MKIICLAGVAGSGKTRATKILKETYGDSINIFAYADKLKKIVKYIFPDSDPYTQEGKQSILGNNLSMRYFLIELAKPIKEIDIDYFSKELLNFKPEDIVVVDGIRFKTEYDFIVKNFKREDYLIIKINNVSNPVVTKDVFEKFPFDVEIINRMTCVYDKKILKTVSNFIN